MVSVPSYDSNLFVNGINHIDYNTLLNAEDRPLLNPRAVRQLPAELDGEALRRAGRARARSARKPEDTIVSTGEFHIPGDSKRALSRRRALGPWSRRPARRPLRSQSTRTSTACALEMGIDRFSATLAGKFGFGSADRHRPDRRVVRRAAVARMEARALTTRPGIRAKRSSPASVEGAWVVTPIQLGQSGQRHRRAWRAPPAASAARTCRDGIQHRAAAGADADVRSRTSSAMRRTGPRSRRAWSASSTPRAAPRMAPAWGFPVHDRRQDLAPPKRFRARTRNGPASGLRRSQRHQVLFEVFRAGRRCAHRGRRRARGRPQRRARRARRSRARSSIPGCASTIRSWQETPP